MSQISRSAIAGVWPVERGEASIARAMPSISASGLGRTLGRIYGLPYAIGFFIHILTLPVPVLLAAAMFFFSGFRRYTVSSTRVRICRGFGDQSGPEVLLTELDDVRMVVRSGQEFYRAADLELISGGQIALTLPGVQNAEPFLHNILEARDAVVQVAACHKALAAAAS